MGAFGGNRTQAQVDDIVAATQVPYDQAQADREGTRVPVTRNGVFTRHRYGSGGTDHVRDGACTNGGGGMRG